MQKPKLSNTVLPQASTLRKDRHTSACNDSAGSTEVMSYDQLISSQRASPAEERVYPQAIVLEPSIRSANLEARARSFYPNRPDPGPTRKLTFVIRSAVSRPFGRLLALAGRRVALSSRCLRPFLRLVRQRESTVVCRLPCALAAGRGSRRARGCCAFAHTNNGSIAP